MNPATGIHMTKITDLEREIAKLKERNARVEADKAWETSMARRGLLMVFTFLAIGLYLNAVRIPDPWLNAIVPTIAFMLSTLTLPIFKKIWLGNRR